MAGGGSGTQNTSNTASYPDEFKPLATGAANQITAMQNALPLSGFANPNPGQTAGIAPFQQAAMNMAPYLLSPSWGLQTLQNMGGPINQLANNAIGVGNQTSPFSSALAALSSGGFGSGHQSFPGASPSPGAAPQSSGASAQPPPFQPPPPSQQPPPFQMQNPNMAQAPEQPTIAGPGTDTLIQSLIQQLSAPIPQSTPILQAPITGPATIPPGARPLQQPPPARPGQPAPRVQTPLYGERPGYTNNTVQPRR